MANVIRQDIIEIGFKTDLSTLNKVNSGMDDLKKSVTGGNDGLDEMKKNADKATKSVSNLGNNDGVEKLKNEVQKTKDGVNDLGNKAKKTKGIFDKFKNVDMNKLKSSLEKVDTKLTAIAKKAGGAAYRGLKRLASISFKALTAGIAAVGAVIGNAVSSYANYEQQLGGVQTLFGTKGVSSVEEYAKSVGKSVEEVKDKYNTLIASENAVVKNANNAYKTAGLSANDYMETVTSFSASLLQSLDGDTMKAASVADRAIRDMSDNANKMGTSMESIQYAYQGFAKQNYTMLDNLKLGYGGTKTEMQRLVKDAAKLTDIQKELGVSIDADSLSYANVVDAISVVQQKLGITGTTAKEAAFTISGSLNSMKAAWGNLMPALIKGGDEFDQCIKNLKESIVGVVDKDTGKRVGGVINNLLPAIKSALEGAGELVEEISPIIAQELPTLIQTLLPPLIKASATLIVNLAKELPTLLPPLIAEIAKALYEGFTGNTMSDETFEGIKTKVTDAFTAIQNIVVGVISFSRKLFAALKPILMFIGSLVLGIITFIGNNINWLLPIIASLIAAFLLFKAVMIAVKVVTAAYNVVQKIMGVLGKTSAKTVAENTTQIGNSAAKSAPNILQIAVAILAVGAAILMICIGFALLAQSAIALANAGWGAIAVMIGMVAAIALLAWGASLLGASLTAGAVGFISFGAAMLMAGAGIALVGVGALLAANALKIIALVLPLIVSYGLMGAVSIAALGASMTVFAIGAAVAGVAATILSVGLIALALSLTLLAASVVALTLATTLFLVVVTGLLAVFTGLVLTITIMNVQFMMLMMMFTMITASSMLLLTSLTLLSATVIVFTAALTPLSAVMLVLMPTTVLFTATMAALMAVFILLAPMAMIFAASMKILQPAFKSLSVTAPIFEKALSPLAATFTKLVVPTGLFVKAIKPLSTQFNSLAKSVTTINKNLEQMAAAVLVMVAGLNNFIATMRMLVEIIAKCCSVIMKNISSTAKTIVSTFGKINLTPCGVKMMNSLLTGINSRKSAIISAINSIASSIQSRLNSVISSANYTLNQFGSSNTINPIKYASGTNGHKGGNAIVNDGSGAELVIMPNGLAFIPNGKNVFLPNAPKGMKVLNASDTANFMGRKASTFNYANGTGDIDVLSFDNGSKLASALIKNSVDYKGMSGYGLSLSKAVVSTVEKAMSTWAGKVIDEYGAKGLESYVASKGVSQWRSTVIRALKLESQYTAANVKRTLYQMQTESGGNPRAINNWDSNAKKGTPSKGLMQVIDPTFRAYARSGYNSNIYDPLSNILASIRYAVSRYGSLARAYQGHGYENGGIATKPSIFGENGAEMAIPLSARKRNRGLSLWSKAGSILGATPYVGDYSPENGSSGYSTSSTEYSTYAPVFNLTISGSNDDRILSRKVKRWISEAMEDTFEGIERRNPVVKEV